MDDRDRLEVKEGLEDGVIEEDGVDDRDRLEVKEGLEDGGIEEDWVGTKDVEGVGEWDTEEDVEREADELGDSDREIDGVWDAVFEEDGPITHATKATTDSGAAWLDSIPK